VNSANAMVGMRGAVLTNMVFLPTSVVTIQVMPYGDL
jgi:capsular polysaccharide biosynthesis protein